MRSLRAQSNYTASTAALDSELQLHLELIRDGRRKEDGIELGETVVADFALRGRRRFECHSSCLRSGTLNLADCGVMYGFSNLKKVL
jgi:hypothetical protein